MPVSLLENWLFDRMAALAKFGETCEVPQPGMSVGRKRVAGLALDITTDQFDPRIECYPDHVPGFSRSWDDSYSQRMVAMILEPWDFEPRDQI